MDHWLEFTARLGCSTDFADAVSYLNQVLEPCTYLVGHAITIADMAVWGALRGRCLLNASPCYSSLPLTFAIEFDIFVHFVAEGINNTDLW